MKKQSNYSEQVKSPLWQKKRLEVLNLRGFKCEICGNETEQLHVHHRFYIKGRKIHEYDNDVLQVLCETCHGKEHEKKDVPVKYSELIECIEILQKMVQFGKVDKQLSYVLKKIIVMNDVNFLSNLSLLSCFRDFEFFVRHVNMYADLFNAQDELNQLKGDNNG